MAKVTVEIFTAGDGINYPKPGQTVTVHYTGYLIDGSQWDSSRDRGKPFKFKLGAEQVIRGLDDGISQLSIGERAKIIIPPGLGYGAKGFPGLIPPNSTLIFDVNSQYSIQDLESWGGKPPGRSTLFFTSISTTIF